MLTSYHYINSGCGKGGAFNWSVVTCQGSTRSELQYLEVCWPRAGGLTTVNANGAQLRDPINPGLTRRRMYGDLNENGRRRDTRKEFRKYYQIQSEYGDDQADAAVSRDQILRRERGQ